MQADGSAPTNLTTSSGTSDRNAAWSPDGSQIAFVHAEQFDADGNPLDLQVWVMDADGTHKQQLTFDSPPKDQVPDWSPDGSKIAYGSGASGRISHDRYC